MKRLLGYLAIVSLIGVQAKDTNIRHSRIILPRQGSENNSNTPLITGMVRNVSGKPLKNRRVFIFVDERVVGIVPTNNDGIFCYQLRQDQALSTGVHTAQAFIQINDRRSSWIDGTLFFVDGTRCDEELHRSGNGSAAHSGINFPFNTSIINSTRPTIVGVVREANNNPVVNETVRISIDAQLVGVVKTNKNGIFSYTLTNEQSLTEGTHTIAASCVESNIILSTISFRVDTQSPAAPTIGTPANNQTLNSSTVAITGSTEPEATVIVYVDSDTIGDIVYADHQGSWTAEYALEPGAHQVAAQAEDLAGNLGELSSVVSFSISL